MSVRCSCGMEVSEWAARCPTCRADVTGLVSDASADEHWPEGPPDDHWPEGPPVEVRRSDGLLRRRGGRGWLLAAGATAAAGVLVAVVAGRGSTPTRPVAADPQVPSTIAGAVPSDSSQFLPLALQESVVVYTDAPQPISVVPGATVTASSAAVASAALPGAQPVSAGTNGAVALGTGVHTGEALYLSSAGGDNPLSVIGIGQADTLVPGTGSLVGIGRTHGDVVTVDVLDITQSRLAVTHPAEAPMILPAGDRPVAVLSDGSVAVRTEQNQLLVIGVHGPGVSLGQLGAVLSVTGRTLAWTSATGCTPVGACPLELTDLSTGRTRAVPPPAGTYGFAVGGAFSPDGSTLLAFAAPPSDPGASLVSLTPVFVEVASAHVDKGLPSVASRAVQGVPVGVAWWVAGGSWAVYSGLVGVVSSANLQGTVVGLGLPASYALALL